VGARAVNALLHMSRPRAVAAGCSRYQGYAGLFLAVGPSAGGHGLHGFRTFSHNRSMIQAQQVVVV